MSRSYRKSLCTKTVGRGFWIRRMKRFGQRNVRIYRYFDEVSNGGWYKKLCSYSSWDYDRVRPRTEARAWREINEGFYKWAFKDEENNKKTRFQFYYKWYKAK